MVAFPAQEHTDAGNALLAYARKVLFRPTIVAPTKTVGLNKTTQAQRVEAFPAQERTLLSCQQVGVKTHEF